MDNLSLIDIYYSLYDYYKDDEIIITAISYIARRNKRPKPRQTIRQDLKVLNLKKYQSILLELSNLPNSELDKFKILYFSNLSNILNTLIILDEINIKYTDTKDIDKLNKISELVDRIKGNVDKLNKINNIVNRIKNK
jgi:hypothetical protein